MLSLIIFLPLIGVLLILGLKPEQRQAIRWVAFAASMQAFMMSLTLLQGSGAGEFAGFASTMYLVEKHVWMPQYGVSYYLGVDGLSFLMVALTGLLTSLSILASFTAITKHEKTYYSLILLLQSGINGTFLALDLVLFYIFWEFMLIPLFFLIGMYGSKNRIAATVKFLLFTFAGSVFMLVAILYIIAKAGTSDITQLVDMVNAGTLVFTDREAFWLFLGLFVAFAIKVPMFPLHTWLPDAHTEAPTAGSVLLAGVLLKTGAYGIIRFCLPLFPQAAHDLRVPILLLATVAIIQGALAAMAQTDLKRLVAYSSVSHMGFIMLGLFAFNEMAATGAMLQLLNHGISTSGLFLCVGMLYERRHTRELSEFGGIAARMKVYAALTMIMLLSSVGLPLLNGFVGEFWILAGAFRAVPVLAGISALGVILGAVYLLTMYQRVFYGPLDNPENKTLTDLNDREIYTLAPLVFLAFWIGVYSAPFTQILEPVSKQTVAKVWTLPAPVKN